MQVRVVTFARLRELLGFGEREFDCAPRATLEDLWTVVTSGVPEAAGLRAATRFARNGVVADATTELGEGDEIALLPPVGGG